MPTTPSPDLPDWTAGGQPITVPTKIATVVVPSGGQTAFLDVSAFSSVFLSAPNTSTREIFATFVNETTGSHTEQSGTSPVLVNNVLCSVSGRFLQLTDISNTGTTSVEIWGFGRVVSDPRAIVAGHATEPINVGLTAFAFVAGTQYFLNAQPDTEYFQGPAFLWYQINGTTVTGLLGALTSGGNTQWLGDTAETHAAPNAQRSDNKMCALPANINGIAFLAEVSGTASIVVRLTPAY